MLDIFINIVIIKNSVFGSNFIRSRKKLRGILMRVVNSLKSARNRHKNCKLVRRKGRVYVINKTNPKFKARQG